MHCSPQDTGINFNTKVPSYSQLFHLIFSRLSSAKSSVYTDPLRGFVDFLPPKQRAKRWVGADLCFVNSNYANAEALQGHRQIFDSSWYIALAGLGFQFSPHERAVIRILLDKEARILQTYASFLLQRGLIWNLRVESDPNKKYPLFMQNKLHSFDDNTHSEVALSIIRTENNSKTETEVSAEVATVRQFNFALNVHPLISKQIPKIEGVMEFGGEVTFSSKPVPHLTFISFAFRLHHIKQMPKVSSLAKLRMFYRPNNPTPTAIVAFSVTQKQITNQFSLGMLLNGLWSRIDEENSYLFRSLMLGVGGKYFDLKRGTLSFFVGLDESLQDDGRITMEKEFGVFLEKSLWPGVTTEITLNATKFFTGGYPTFRIAFGFER
jgi:hypothetical protein